MSQADLGPRNAAFPERERIRTATTRTRRPCSLGPCRKRPLEKPTDIDLVEFRGHELLSIDVLIDRETDITINPPAAQA